MFEKDRPHAAIVAWAASALAFLLTLDLPHRWLHWAILGVNVAVTVLGLASYALVRRASRSWPIASGCVEFTEVKEDAERNILRPFILHIAYSYRAAGERHSGFHEEFFRRAGEASALAGSSKGHEVIVRYNPAVPEQSALQWSPRK